MRRMVLMLAGILALSCASRTAPPAAAPAAAAPNRERQADEIIALDRQIQDWRLELDLKPDPPRQFYGLPDPPWSPPRFEANAECTDVCRLAEHICANKDDICRIADQLPGDTWAKGKCDSAKASCSEAKERCEKCGK